MDGQIGVLESLFGLLCHRHSHVGQLILDRCGQKLGVQGVVTGQIARIRGVQAGCLRGFLGDLADGILLLRRA